MKPDKKYMSQSSGGNTTKHFVPPTFSSKIRMNGLFNSSFNPNNYNDSNDYNNSNSYNNYNSTNNSNTYNDPNSSNSYNGYDNSNNYNDSNNSNNYNNPNNSNSYNSSSNYNNSTNSYLNLYPSETESEFLYCYYSSFGDCKYNNKNYNKHNNYRIPTPSEALINLDMDIDLDELNGLDRTCCNNDIDAIYSKIEKDHSGIFTTLSSYKVPYPISRIMVRRLVKLTLSYCEKEGD